ncbi:MAG: hypothetical protein UW32_C0001G0176 [Candidatus Wolfebacteria bacterium GW2011_GWE2_44_13]|uniref:Uncharacterized protein n=1 Tax=Candidatus Wolfebacteria bacterium GW2011_GWE2_44_13 TaxID=1619017 RepID=A0A0G1K6V6_9BACT|nr:MAG: hypothetical protein UW32_C0001G0176 [Candidatus Wolfebacteria bacterium GW2011_GWE2_44_13]
MYSNSKINPLLLGILAAMIIHSAAVLIRELSPIQAIAPLVDVIAFHPTWAYIITILFFALINFRTIRERIICLPKQFTPRTVETQKLILAYEAIALAFLLIIFPAIAYFYAIAHKYTAMEYPGIVRFMDYMPIADVITQTISSFPLFITFFIITSALCFSMPHSYLTYKYEKKAPAPLHSAINFSILLSIIITLLLITLLVLNLEPWILIALIFVGPITLLAFIAINIMMLRYHDKFIKCK